LQFYSRKFPIVICSLKLSNPLTGFKSQFTIKKTPKGEFLNGGAGGIRTLDTGLHPYNGLANRRLQPLGHSSIKNANLLQGWLVLRLLAYASGQPLGHSSIKNANLLQGWLVLSLLAYASGQPLGHSSIKNANLLQWWLKSV
jgi:hypothetical protein